MQVFYLNLVGFKVGHMMNNEAERLGFYLNLVGFKAQSSFCVCQTNGVLSELSGF